MHSDCSATGAIMQSSTLTATGRTGRLVEKKKNVKAKQSLLKMLLTCVYKPYLNSLKHDDMQEVSLFIKCTNICIIVSTFCHLSSPVNHTTLTKPLPTLADVSADIFFFQTQETCREFPNIYYVQLFMSAF